MRIEYHRTLLADRIRNAAFYEALRRVIVKGRTTVADIGAGTGLLGFMAARLGAREVILYEAADVAKVARAVARQNRIRNCRIIAACSTEVSAPEPVDVAVSETLGNYALEEHIVETMNDARERLLKPGGVMIPSRIDQFVCPVIGDRHFRDLSSWDDVGFGLDFTPAKIMSLNNIYVRWLEPSELLEGGRAARLWDSIDFSRRVASARRGAVCWDIERPTSIYGFALWWSAKLGTGLWLGTGPLEPRTHWEQLYLPVVSPISVGPGESITLDIKSTTTREAGTDVAWTITHRNASGRRLARQALDLEKGFLR
jgi:protein arginine N-methyltransferase 1